MSNNFLIREAKKEEYKRVGEIMVKAYASLSGFLSIEESPEYYNKLANVGDIISSKSIKLFVASTSNNEIGGAVVYFGDMKYYGSGGMAPKVHNAAGFRFLAVDEKYRGHSLGRLLSEHCLQKAQKEGANELIIHTTEAMKLAWGMYERIGFKRSEDLDFSKGNLKVYGFRFPFV